MKKIKSQKREMKMTKIELILGHCLKLFGCF